MPAASRFDIAAVDVRAPDAPRAFTRSLHDTGFAVLRHHPIDPARIARLYQGWAAFFASPEIDDYLFDPVAQDGYFPFRSENARDSAVKDLKAFFHVYPGTRLPPALAADTMALYQDLLTLGALLLGWLQDHLPPAIRDRLTEPLPAMLAGSMQSLFRVLHYPALPADVEPGAVRAAAHEDINLITLLVAGTAPGLEARDRAGTWHAVPCDPGMIVVNGGDMLAVATAGFLPATPHRVVNPPAGQDVARQSMPMFLHPRPEVVLAPGLTAGAFLDQRLREIGLKS